MAGWILCKRKSDGQPCRARLMEGAFRVRDLASGEVSEGDPGDFLVRPAFGPRYAARQADLARDYEDFREAEAEAHAAAG